MAGLGFTNDVALVALIVSLIALVISIGQMLQAYLGTAEGYRRCQDSVIGPWAQYTRLRWRWSEFRFETRFTTPEICLLTRMERVNPKNIRTRFLWWRLGFETVIRTDGAGEPPREEVVDEKNPHHDDHVIRRRSGFHRNVDLLDFDILDQGGHVPLALRKTVTISRDRSSRGTDLVSWTRLLRSLHQYQITAGSAQLQQNADAHSSSVSPGDARVTVRLKEWSWDLVPPDLVRPYATSTVGTMISLAHRLGMQWSAIDPAKGQMNADGAGHDINSAVIRGLGIVIQYSYNSRLDPYSFRMQPLVQRQGVPTHAADKLRCGIISDSALGTGEHSIIGQKGDLAPLEDVLVRLKVGRQAQAVVMDEENLASLRKKRDDIRHVLNDMVCLTCPFMPLHNDFRNEITWPLPTTGLHSALIFWEGRKALVARLKHYIDQNADAPEPLSKHAWKLLNTVREQYWANFYCVWHKAISQSEAYIRDLRRIYDETTTIFSNKDPQFRNDDVLQSTYLHLVGAHLTMATEVGQSARNALRNGQRIRVEEPEYPTQSVVPYISEVAHQYVDNLDRVVELVQGQSPKMPAGAIKGLWWIMMLRGIVWSMSVNITRQALVPSYLYYSTTPVYLV